MFEHELQAKAAQFHALAAELASAISVETSGRLAVDVLPELLAGVRQGELATCRAIERADRSGEYAVDGAASVTAYVKQVSGERAEWASARAHVGRALADHLPSTSEAWEKGQLGFAHATVIDKATRRTQDPELVAELDQFLAGLAYDHSPSELASAAEHLLAQAAPEESAKKAAAQRAAQKLSLSQTLDGMWRLSARLDAEAGMIVAHTIATFLQKPDPEADPATQTIERRRVNALVQMCRHAMAHEASCADEPGGGRDVIIVGIDHERLMDQLGTGATSSGVVLPAATIRRMACDAQIIPAVYGSKSEVLDYGRKARVVPPSLKRLLIVRDGGCVFAGCDRPGSWTEAHHRRHWVKRGKTKEDELDLLCVFHHHLVHEGGWTMTVDDDAERTPWFHPPDGRPSIKGQRRPIVTASFVKDKTKVGGVPCRR